jgi:hypothetical protein
LPDNEVEITGSLLNDKNDKNDKNESQAANKQKDKQVPIEKAQ